MNPEEERQQQEQKRQEINEAIRREQAERVINREQREDGFVKAKHHSPRAKDDAKPPPEDD
jgi:hypothetical protein